MSLRVRLTAVLLIVVVIVIGSGTTAHLLEVSAQLERGLDREEYRVVHAIHTELTRMRRVLDEELRIAISPGFVDRWLGKQDPRGLLGARDRLQAGRVDILKVLDNNGGILTSAHWPASFGALDGNFPRYRRRQGSTPTVVEEPVAEGTEVSLQRWRKTRLFGRELFVVAGRFLSPEGLEDLRTRVGADVMAICTRVGDDVGRRYGKRANSPGSLKSCKEVVGAFSEPLDDDDGDAWLRFEERFQFRLIALPGSQSKARFLLVGLDRRASDAIGEGIIRRALVVGLLSILLAAVLAVLLAGRLVQPLEALAKASESLAQGDLSVRLSADGSSEIKRMVDAFNNMAAELERSSEQLRRAERVAAWREIARGLAHELKNPLTPILGAMDVIKRAYEKERPDFDEILHEQAAAVVEEVMRLKELSDSFARFARLPDPQFAPQRLDDTLDKVLALYVPESETLRIDRRIVVENPSVRADKTQLLTVLTNLVKNAVEAIEHAENDNDGVIRVSVVDVDDGFELRIDDSGDGIAESVRDQLFMPYVTTKGSRGTGLGLALVHRIVAEHDGHIEVGDSDLGGARFSVWLPAARAEPSVDDDKPPQT